MIRKKGKSFGKKLLPIVDHDFELRKSLKKNIPPYEVRLPSDFDIANDHRTFPKAHRFLDEEKKKKHQIRKHENTREN